MSSWRALTTSQRTHLGPGEPMDESSYHTDALPDDGRQGSWLPYLKPTVRGFLRLDESEQRIACALP